MTSSNVVDIYATSEPFEQWLECTLSEINHKLGDLIYKEQVNQLWKREMESTVRNIRVSVCSQRVIVSVSCQTDEQLAQAYDSSPRCSEAKEDAIESVNPSFSVVENDSSPSVVADTHMEEHSESYTSSRSESAESYQCIHCEATFSRKDEFSKHQQSHGKYIKEPQMCQFCLQVFKNQKALSRHTNLRTCQGKDKSNYDCSTCGKSFDTLGKLTYHRLHHREKKCLCTLCGKAFHHPVQLNRHMRVHTGEKPYSCTVCSKRFSTEYNCRHHIRVRHVE